MGWCLVGFSASPKYCNDIGLVMTAATSNWLLKIDNSLYHQFDLRLEIGAYQCYWLPDVWGVVLECMNTKEIALTLANTDDVL